MTLDCKRIRRGFTLVEVVLAAGVSAVICVGVAVMMRGVGVEILAHDASRSESLTREVAAWRIGSVVRPGSEVLHCSEEMLVLWRGDLDSDDVVELSEIVVLRHEAEAGVLFVSRAPDDLPDGSDTALEMHGDLVGAVESAMGGEVFVDVRLVSEVERVEFYLDTPIAHLASRVCVDLEFLGDMGGFVTTTASLRGSGAVACELCEAMSE